MEHASNTVTLKAGTEDHEFKVILHHLGFEASLGYIRRCSLSAKIRINALANSALWSLQGPRGFPMRKSLLRSYLSQIGLWDMFLIVN